MRRKILDATLNLMLSWCAAAMVVLGSWMPPIIEAPEPPRMSRSHGLWFESE